MVIKNHCLVKILGCNPEKLWYNGSAEGIKQTGQVFLTPLFYLKTGRPARASAKEEER
jgi:hypothetical protein